MWCSLKCCVNDQSFIRAHWGKLDVVLERAGAFCHHENFCVQILYLLCSVIVYIYKKHWCARSLHGRISFGWNFARKSRGHTLFVDFLYEHINRINSIPVRPDKGTGISVRANGENFLTSSRALFDARVWRADDGKEFF